MDPQIRNFRDFLQLYNRVTEICFSNCVNNFFNRDISRDESECLDKCVHKYAQVNQRIMNVYVEVQTLINERRLTELDSLAQTQQQQAIDSSPQMNDSPQNSAMESTTTLSQVNTKEPLQTDGAAR